MGSSLFFSATGHCEIKKVSLSSPGGQSVGRKIELTPIFLRQLLAEVASRGISLMASDGQT